MATNQSTSISRKNVRQEKPRIQYAEVTIAALTGEISAQHLYDPPTHPYHGSTSRIWPLERALEDLAEGGYVIDLQPLADHPNIISWVYRAPMSNGRIAGDEIDRLSDAARESAREMLFGLEGDFQGIAFLAASRFGEPLDGTAGPFDEVSAEYRAAYWGSRGALIGKRVGNMVHWSDGQKQEIGPAEQGEGSTSTNPSI